MIGIITGLGTRAGHKIINKFLETVSAEYDEDWPEFMNINIVVPFGADASINNELKNKLDRATRVLAAAKCSPIVIACNTVHGDSVITSHPAILDWTLDFKAAIDSCSDVIVLASKQSIKTIYADYECEDATDIIENFIGSTGYSDSFYDGCIKRIKEINSLVVNNSVRLVLGCTELILIEDIIAKTKEDEDAIQFFLNSVELDSASYLAHVMHCNL